MADYLHGPEVLFLDAPQTPIRVLRASVIGLVANADDADSNTFPEGVPVLVNSDKVIADAGTTGTLKNALTDIYKQGRALVVVIRVPEGIDAAVAEANIIGQINADESRTGIEAFAHAEALTGVRPRILIAPEFSSIAAVGAQLEALANKLRAIAIIEGSGGNLAAVDAERSTYAKSYFVNPGIAYGEVTRGASATVAGHIIRVDDELGYWHSPSNQKIFGITGTSQPVDHTLGDPTSTSNLYSEKNITTIVKQNGGFFLWGNSLADGTLITHERIRNIVADSILYYSQQYIDKNITSEYVDWVISRTDNFLRTLQKRGVIAAGRVWYDSELNDDAALANRQVFFDYELALWSVAERVTFRQHSRLATTGEIFDVSE